MSLIEHCNYMEWGKCRSKAESSYGQTGALLVAVNSLSFLLNKLEKIVKETGAEWRDIILCSNFQC